MHLFLSPMRATCHANLVLLDLITQALKERSPNYEAPQCAIFSTPLLPLATKAQISSSVPHFKCPRSVFLPQCERPNFTPIQNNMQNYNAVYFHSYIFSNLTGKQKNSAPNIRRHPQNSICSSLLHQYNSNRLGLFPNIRNLSQF